MDRPVVFRIVGIVLCAAMLIGFPIAANSKQVRLAEHTHQMSETIVDQEPGCVAEGVGHIECLFEGCDYREPSQVTALGHSVEDGICCSRCLEYFSPEIDGLCETDRGLLLVKDCAVQKDMTGHYREDGTLWYIREGVAYDYYCGDQQFTWPTPTCGIITSYFGYRNAPTAGASTYHKGIDVGAMHGTTIVSIADGTVAETGSNEWNGNYVYVDHKEGIRSAYLHCSEIYVNAGETVSAGDKIAAVGSTGISTGAHLHMTVYLDGEPINPLFYVSNEGYPTK